MFLNYTHYPAMILSRWVVYLGNLEISYLSFVSLVSTYVPMKQVLHTVVTRTNGMWKSTNRKTSCSALDTNDPKMIDTSFESPKCKL